MSMNRYEDARPIFDRRHGPATGAAGDGQEGTYFGVLHTAPVNGTCKVIIPAMDLTTYRTANVAPYVTGSAGDTCVIVFDANKTLWVISAQGIQDISTAPGDFVFSGASSRVGALLCNGNPYSPTTYPLLYDAIGYSYGGTSTTPLLPTLIGRVPVGAGTGTASGATAWSISAPLTTGPGGEQTHLLLSTESGQPASSTQGDTPDHTHTVTVPSSQQTLTNNYNAYDPEAGFNAVSGWTFPGTATSGASNQHTHPIAAANAASAHNTMPPVCVGNWFIFHG